MMTKSVEFFRRIRSFVRREGRMTDGQIRAIADGMPNFGLHIDSGFVDFVKIFGRDAPCILEIGFGMGHSLLHLAKENPTKNFMGIETHLPGVGSLLSGIQAAGIHNLRVYHADAVTVLSDCIPNRSLDVIQIFFPDPWPKRRHHKRRLIQPKFIDQILKKLKPQGMIHLATDWEDYAKHMMRVLSSFSALENIFSVGEYAMRSQHRPVPTKFELRAKRAGHCIRELQFVKK